MDFNLLEILANNLVKPLHHIFVSQRRTKVLSHRLVQFLPFDRPLTGVDVGCGTGKIAMSIQKLRLDVKLTCIDVVIRDDAVENIIMFDGKKIPFDDKSYDFTMLVDVLHHIEDPAAIMRECARVSRKFILIVDHVCESSWDRLRLCFMDWVGNLGYDANFTYKYLSKSDWQQLYRISKGICEAEIFDLNLYPFPFSILFDGKLHFMAKLKIS